MIKLSKQLSREQVAWSMMSQEWKKQSNNLFQQASNLDEFEDAVTWCGIEGNVIRTLPSMSISSFAKYLYDNRISIIKGTFDLSKMQGFGGKTPYSWASKICHIISPQNYPLIYDSKIREALRNLGINVNSIHEFCKILNQERLYYQGLTNSQIYKIDSDLWAYHK